MSPPNNAILRFDEITLTGEQLKAIPEDQAAFLALLLAAYNEVNTLLRLYCLFQYEVTDPHPAEYVSISTKLFIARTLSAKYFEVIELFKGNRYQPLFAERGRH